MLKKVRQRTILTNLIVQWKLTACYAECMQFKSWHCWKCRECCTCSDLEWVPWNLSIPTRNWFASSNFPDKSQQKHTRAVTRQRAKLSFTIHLACLSSQIDYELQVLLSWNLSTVFLWLFQCISLKCLPDFPNKSYIAGSALPLPWVKTPCGLFLREKTPRGKWKFPPHKFKEKVKSDDTF